MFFHTLVCPYQHFSMIERRYSPPEKTSVKTNCPLNCTHNPTIDEVHTKFQHPSMYGVHRKCTEVLYEISRFDVRAPIAL